MHLDPSQVRDFETDGAILIKGLFSGWVHKIQTGIERNLAEPGPYAAENLNPHEPGRFFDDYCNWNRIAEFEEVTRRSDVGRVAAELMRSDRTQLFHDHVLIKEPDRKSVV